MPVNGAEDVSETLQLIWENTPKLGRQRSSKAELEKEWRKIPRADRPGQGRLVESLDQWNKSQSWGEGYIPGIHRWVKQRQWEQDPEPAKTSTGVRTV